MYSHFTHILLRIWYIESVLNEGILKTKFLYGHDYIILLYHVYGQLKKNQKPH